jgi:hypothetical protein
MKEIVLEIGSSIDEGIERAIFLAAALDESIFGGSDNMVTFDANGIRIVVAANSKAELIYRDWRRAISGCINPEYVGPWPEATLTKEEQERDAEIQAQKEKEREAFYDKIRAKQEAKTKALEKKLSSAAEIDLVNKPLWDEGLVKNKDFYGRGVYIYAERWARLMQLGIKSGKQLEDIAEKTSREADVDGITGFMYGCAVSILSQGWKYGEDLRRWHNKKIQIGNEGDRANEEGGVLNPAMLSFGSSD